MPDAEPAAEQVMEQPLETPLDAVCVRVLGSLVEKEITTPDNYPLTLNSIVSACNQTSNRDPVMSLDESAIQTAIDELTNRLLVRQVYKSESRAKRYRHTISETLHLHPAEIAVMCVLMLRGAQTAGEIRTRTARLFEFRDVPHVDVTLQVLMTMSTPLVAQLARRPGQKEVRYAHLLAGEPDEETHSFDAGAQPAPALRPDTPSPQRSMDGARIEALESAVDALRAELAELRARFDELGL